MPWPRSPRAAHLSRSGPDRAAPGGGRVRGRADGAHHLRRRRRRGDRSAGARVRRARRHGRGPAAHLRHVQVGGRHARRPLRDGAAPAGLLGGRGGRRCARSRARPARGERPKLLFVANPNNPDGSVTPRRDLAAPARPAAAWSWWTRPTSTSAARRAWRRWCASATTWWCCARSASWPGMAGLRVGYGLLPLPVIKHIWKVKQPYTPNVAGTVAALAALSDRPWLDTHRAASGGGAAAARRRARRAGLADAAAEPHQLRPVPRGRRPARRAP